MTNSSPYEAKTWGKSKNFFQEVTVSSATFQELADVVINIRGTIALSLVNEGTVQVDYCFDNGHQLSGTMKASTPTSALMFDHRRVDKIWFRVPNGGSAVVRVEAWCI